MKKISFLLILTSITLSAIFAKSTLNLSVKGMHCGGCETKFKTAASSINGITEVKSVSVDNSTAIVEYDEKTISAEKVVKSLADQTGFTISASTGTSVTTVEGKPSSCCAKGQSGPACTQGETKKVKTKKVKLVTETE